MCIYFSPEQLIKMNLPSPSRKRDQRKYFRVMFPREVRLCVCFFSKFIYWLPRRFRLTLSSPGRAKAAKSNFIFYASRDRPTVASGSCYCLAHPQSAFLLFIKTALANEKGQAEPRCFAETREYTFVFLEDEEFGYYAVDAIIVISLIIYQRDSCVKVPPLFRYPPRYGVFIRLVGIYAVK